MEFRLFAWSWAQDLPPKLGAYVYSTSIFIIYTPWTWGQCSNCAWANLPIMELEKPYPPPKNSCATYRPIFATWGNQNERATKVAELFFTSTVRWPWELEGLVHGGSTIIAGYITKIIVIGIISHLKETIAVDKPIKIPPTAPPSIVMFAARITSCMSTHAHLGEEANVKI